MSISHAFNAGWQDRLLSLPTPPKYERCRTGIAVAYERGRHAAALYEAEMHKRGYHIQWPGTSIQRRPDYVQAPAYAHARKVMSKELRALIRAEARFCSLKKPTWSY